MFGLIFSHVPILTTKQQHLLCLFYLLLQCSQNLVRVCVCPQFCLTMCNPMDYSPLGSSVYGIFRTRILEWVAISYSRGSCRPRDWTHISCISCVGRWVIYHWGATWEAPKIMDHGIEIESDVWVHPRSCVVVVQSPNHVQLFVTPWTAARQASLSLTNSRSLPKFIPIELAMPPNHLILCHHFLLLLSIFPSIRVFANESLVHRALHVQVHHAKHWTGWSTSWNQDCQEKFQ